MSTDASSTRITLTGDDRRTIAQWIRKRLEDGVTLTDRDVRRAIPALTGRDGTVAPQVVSGWLRHRKGVSRFGDVFAGITMRPHPDRRIYLAESNGHRPEPVGESDEVEGEPLSLSPRHVKFGSAFVRAVVGDEFSDDDVEAIVLLAADWIAAEFS